MGQNISFDIENFIDNDPVLLIIFFSLSLFGSLIKFIFTENTNKKNKKTGWKVILRMALLSLTSSLFIFSSLEILRKYITGNLMYLAVFFFGFISDMLIKQLARFKNLKSLMKFLDDLYSFLKSRK